MRLESLGTGVVFLSALFAVLNRDNIDAGLAGLAISYAMNVTSTLNWCASPSVRVCVCVFVCVCVCMCECV